MYPVEAATAPAITFIATEMLCFCAECSGLFLLISGVDIERRETYVRCTQKTGIGRKRDGGG